MSHFKDRIEEAQKKLDTAKTDIAELMGMAEAEQRDLSDDESLQLEAYAADVESTEKRISDLERAEKAMAQKVVEKQSPALISQRGHQERKPGELVFKRATAAYLAHVEKKHVLDICKERFPSDQGLQAVIKSAIDPAATDVAGWAAELTEEANFGYLDLLRGASIAAQFWARAGLMLQFDGYTALNIPSRAGGTTDLASGWTGQGSAIPVRRGTFATQRIEPYKRGAIVEMTKEMTSRSTPAIMGIIQNGLIEDTATKLDNDYFGEAAAVAGFNPRGIFEGVTGTAASTGGASIAEDMAQDFKNLVSPIYAANMGQSLMIAINPINVIAMSLTISGDMFIFRDELAGGQWFTIPIVQSTNVPVDEIWGLDMAQQAVALGANEFSVSDSATIVEMDDDSAAAPFMGQDYPRDPLGSVGGEAAQIPPASVRSLFQTETVAVKLVNYLSWANLRTGSVNRITGVNY